jgi:hypothetical protein
MDHPDAASMAMKDATAQPHLSGASLCLNPSPDLGWDHGDQS